MSTKYVRELLESVDVLNPERACEGISEALQELRQIETDRAKDAETGKLELKPESQWPQLRLATRKTYDQSVRDFVALLHKENGKQAVVFLRSLNEKRLVYRQKGQAYEPTDPERQQEAAALKLLDRDIASDFGTKPNQ
jgi:hypothetical protein